MFTEELLKLDSILKWHVPFFISIWFTLANPTFSSPDFVVDFHEMSMAESGGLFESAIKSWTRI
jgi:hypothetical protein